MRSNHQLPQIVLDRALGLIHERYADFGPTLACEKLRECHGLVLSKETVRHLMTDAGLWVPRKQRPPKVYQPRARRACFGELVQIDGSEHHWFEDRGPSCTLLVYVDDATSRLMHVALHGDRIDLQLFRGDARVSRAPRQAGGVLQRPRERVLRPQARGNGGQRRHPVWPRDV